MDITRRDFLKSTAGFTVASSTFLSAASFVSNNSLHTGRTAIPGRVVIVKRPSVFTTQETVFSDILYTMLNDGICGLTRHKNSRDAWLSLFSISETIGIKINSLGGKKICTHPDLAYAVARQLINCGIPSHNIIIWDRLSTELEKAGYAINKSTGSIKCFGTDNEYESTIEFSGSIGSCFSSILTRQCDALINIPVLKDHDLSGVSLSLKSFYGAIHNPNKYHDNGCNPFIADLNNHPYIKNKLRLIIIDGLTAQYNGGPAFKPQWTWPYRGLLFSQDPVAVDFTGTYIIEEQRKLKGLPSLLDSGRYPHYIETAAKIGLGIGNLNKIDKIVL